MADFVDDARSTLANDGGILLHQEKTLLLDSPVNRVEGGSLELDKDLARTWLGDLVVTKRKLGADVREPKSFLSGHFLRWVLGVQLRETIPLSESSRRLHSVIAVDHDRHGGDSPHRHVLAQRSALGDEETATGNLSKI